MLEIFDDGGVRDLMAKGGIYNELQQLCSSLDRMKKNVSSIEDD